MNDISSQPRLKKDWTITAESFEHLLKWLDEGSDSQGQSYLAMRSRLVTYFDRKDCTNPDDLADEVLNRVGRRLEEEGEIKTEAPAKYCYTVARFVFMEQFRSPSARQVPVEDVVIKADNNDPEAELRREATMKCLEKCSAALGREQREMIVRYYTGEKGEKIATRKQMAGEFGVSLNALAIRAFRIREKLEDCVKKCLNKEMK